MPAAVLTLSRHFLDTCVLYPTKHKQFYQAGYISLSLVVAVSRPLVHVRKVKFRAVTRMVRIVTSMVGIGTRKVNMVCYIMY